MQTQEITLISGERFLGRSTVVALQQTYNGDWLPSLMLLTATVTNFRFLLQPIKRKYPPATLPKSYIASAELTRRGRYHCIALHLMTGHELCLMQSTGRLDDLYDDLQAMKLPPPRFQFDDSIARRDIQRLIDYFGAMPQPQV